MKRVLLTTFLAASMSAIAAPVEDCEESVSIVEYIMDQRLAGVSTYHLFDDPFFDSSAARRVAYQVYRLDRRFLSGDIREAYLKLHYVYCLEYEPKDFSQWIPEEAK